MLKEKEYYIEHGKANIALKTDIEKTVRGNIKKTH